MNALLGLLSVHYVADFLLQSHWMASNKSKRLDALTAHVAIYTATFWIVLNFGFVPRLAACEFAVITFATHWATDFWTSKGTAKLYGNWHWFFALVGFDQLIHVWTLALTWKWVVQ